MRSFGWGDRVLALDQGVVGLLLTQLAPRTVPGQILAVDPLQGSCKLSMALDADAVVPPGRGRKPR